jgi:hypothetical protein
MIMKPRVIIHNHFAARDAEEYSDYHSSNRRDLEKQILTLTRTVATASDPNLREIARKRLAELKKRL